MPVVRTSASAVLKRALSGLDSTSRAILELLLERVSFVPTAELASAVGVTPRMVRYRLKQLERGLSGLGPAIERKPHLGIRIDVADGMRPLVLEELRRAKHSGFGLGKAKRVEDIVCGLLLAQEPLTAKELARDLGVSRATVLKDMATVEGLLRESGLSLERRSNYGFRVMGEEQGIREALVELIIGRREERASLVLGSGAWGSPSASSGDQVLSPRASGLLGRLDLIFSDGLANQAQRRLGIRLTDRAYASLVVHTAVQLVRVSQGDLVEYGTGLLESIRRQREFATAGWMTAAMEQHLGVEVPVEETVYACVQLACRKTAMPASSLVLASGATIVDEVSAQAADRMISIAATYLHPSLQIDGLLQRGLAAHLYTTINRLRWGLPIRNPLLAEIRADNPHVYEVARASAGVLDALTPAVVPEDEVGYICMHFAAALRRYLPPRGLRKRVLVVCGEGIATAWMLVSRLAIHFPSLEVSEIVSARDLSVRESFGDVDGIISTIQLESWAIPVAVVNPMLTWSDRRRISEVLGLGPAADARREPALESASRDLAGLLGVGRLQVGVKASDWKEVVEKACWPLVEDGAVERRYVTAVQHLIEQYGPFMVLLPNTAVLHAHPDDGVRELSLGVTTLQMPVAFGHETNDPVRVVVVVGAIDNHSHIPALRELIGVLEKAEMRSRAIGAATVSELQDVLLGRSSGPQ